jgi:lipopolysaccharide export system permease protein
MSIAWVSNAGAALSSDTSPTSLRQIRLVPFGWHTRYLLRSYLRYTFIVVAGLLLVALTIDLSAQLGGILAARPEAGTLATAALLAWYLLLRSVDILARNLPLAIYLAVMWCEFTHTLSSERVAVGVAGRSPLQCLIPGLVFGFVFGCVQLTLDLWLRPAAVMTQASEHLGNYGDRFDRRPTDATRWIRVGDDLISARLDFGPPPAFRDVTLYRLQTDLQPREVTIARAAVPAAQPSTWEFMDGYYWEWTASPVPAASPAKSDAQPSPPRAFARRELALDVDPLWLANLGIDGKYLPQPVLRALAASTSPGFAKSDYQTWVQVRYARGLFVLGMALLGASLGQMSLSRLPRLYGLLAMLLAGYSCHVAQKALEILGELGAVPPLVAGWSVPVALMLGAAVAQLKAHGTVG